MLPYKNNDARLLWKLKKAQAPTVAPRPRPVNDKNKKNSIGKRYQSQKKQKTLEKKSAPKILPLPSPMGTWYERSPWFFSSISMKTKKSARQGSWLALTFPSARGSCFPRRVGSDGGLTARANPFKILPKSNVEFSVNISFPENFEFGPRESMPPPCDGHLGWGGKLLLGCEWGYGAASGGQWSSKGGSFRLMFRRDRDFGLPLSHAIVTGYLYLPLEVMTHSTPKGHFGEPWMKRSEFVNNVRPTGTGGWDIFRNEKNGLIIEAGKSYTLSLKVELNSPGKSDGRVGIGLNGNTLELGGLQLTGSGQKIQALKIDAFFGGGTNDWAPYTDQTLLVKDFAVA